MTKYLLNQIMEETNLFLSPTSYSFSNYEGSRHLCLGSRDIDKNTKILVYISLTNESLEYFKPEINIDRMNNMTEFITLFDHIPYSNIEIFGTITKAVSQNLVVYHIIKIEK